MLKESNPILLCRRKALSIYFHFDFKPRLCTDRPSFHVICPQLTQLLTVHKPKSSQLICYFSACLSFSRSACQCRQVTETIRVVLSISASQFALFRSLRCSPPGQGWITRLSSVPITVITCDKPHRGPINTLLSRGPRN